MYVMKSLTNNNNRQRSKAHWLHVLVATALVAMTFTLVPSVTASAASITVTNTNDSGTGSLRDAIDTASSGDTIVIADNVQGTILLSSGQITINKSLTIIGPGADLLTLQGVNDRIFRIGDSNSAIDITITGLRFTRGKISGPEGGGAIYSSQGAGQTLTIRDSKFQRNVAVENGGAVLLDADAALTISGSTFTNNAAKRAGGAITHFSTAPLTVMNSTFTLNVVDTNGGAINIDATGTPTGQSIIENTTFHTNSSGADGDGGAISVNNNAAPLTIRNTTFTSNSSADDEGGAVYHNANFPLSIESSRFTANGASNGAAIYMTKDQGDLTVRNSYFEGNITRNNGGAISIRAQITVLITGSVFYGNHSNEDKGILEFNSGEINATIIDSAIVGNTGGDDSGAGGLYWSSSNGQLDVVNTTISDNVSSEPGNRGIVQLDNGTVNLDSVTITGNVSVTGIAGVSAGNDATVTVRNSIIAGNHSGTAADDCSGTLIFAGGNGTSILGVDNTTTCVSGDTPLIGDAGLDDLRMSTRSNGDATWIVPLKIDSPALGAGSTTQVTDQRGVIRNANSIDIGAVQMRSGTLGLSLTASQPRVATESTTTVTAIVQNNGDFRTQPTILSINIPTNLLTVTGTTGATCDEAISCTLGVLAGEEQRVVELSLSTKEAGDAIVSAQVSATDSAPQQASTTFTIVGGSTMGQSIAPPAAQIVVLSARALTNRAIEIRVRVRTPGRVRVVGVYPPSRTAQKSARACVVNRNIQRVGTYILSCRLTETTRQQMSTRALRITLRATLRSPGLEVVRKERVVRVKKFVPYAQRITN